MLTSLLWTSVVLLMAPVVSGWDRLRPAIAFLAVWSSIEIFLSSVSGREYWHYFITWIPPLGMAACLIFRVTFSVMAEAWHAVRGGSGRAKWIGTAGLIVAVVPLAAMLHQDRALVIRLYQEVAESGVKTRSIQQYELPAIRGRATVKFIAERCVANDALLVWGAEVFLNFQTDLTSPSRFAYQYPLFTKGYTTPALCQSFLEDLRRKPPKLIIDTSGSNEIVPPLGEPETGRHIQSDPKYVVPSGMDEIREYVREHYVPLGRIPSTPWTAYERKGVLLEIP
jgi:hypothetical protein